MSFNTDIGNNEAFSDGLGVIKMRGKYGYVDLNGKIVIPCIYDNAGDFCECRAAVAIKDKCGFIDRNGKQITKLEFDAVSNFSQGFSIVLKGGKYGVIDKNGKCVIPCEYEFIGPFSHGYALAKKNDKYGYFDKTGKVAIDFVYDVAETFSNGSAKIAKDGKLGFLDKDGNEFFGDEAIDIKYKSQALRIQLLYSEKIQKAESKDEIIEILEDFETKMVYAESCWKDDLLRVMQNQKTLDQTAKDGLEYISERTDAFIEKVTDREI